MEPLLWQSRIHGRSGYASCARAVLQEFVKRSHPIAFRSLTIEGSGDPKVLESAWFRRISSQPVPIGANYLIYHTPAGNAGGGFFREARAMNPGLGRYIGYTMFETDRITPAWVSALDAMDEIWVPSRFNVETFSRSGFDASRIHVVPHGIEAERFDPELWPVRRASGGEPFRFLSVFEWTTRKGWDVLVRAYVEEFFGCRDVSLDLFTYRGGGTNSRDTRTIPQRLEAFLRDSMGLELSQCPPIRILEEHISEEEWPRIYAGADAFVLPTRGEGWGLPILEAMAMGLPIAATAWGGQKDFLNADVGRIIAHEGLVEVPLDQIRDNPLFAGHRWASPSVQETRRAMRWIFECREEAKAMGARARESVLDGFTVSKMVDCMEERLGARPPRELFPGWKPDAAAPSSAEPLRLLWIGDDPKEEGLRLLLACAALVFDARDRVTLDLACLSEEGVRNMERLHRFYSRMAKFPIRLIGPASSEEERATLFQKADCFVLPTQRIEESPLCLEAARRGVLILASEYALPFTLRREGASLQTPGLHFPVKGEDGARRLIAKPYPNVLGVQLRWLLEHRDLAKHMVCRARTCLAEGEERGFACAPVPKVSFSPGKDAEGVAEAVQRVWIHPESDLITVAIGEAHPESKAVERLRDMPEAAICLETSSSWVLAAIRVSRARACADFDPHFHGAACLFEFARAVRSEGGLVISEGISPALSPLCQGPQMAAIALLELGERALNEQRKEHARQAFLAALEKHPKYSGALLALARLLQQEGSREGLRQAHALLWDIVSLRPLHSGARHALGCVCFALCLMSEANENLGIAAGIDPQNPTIWNDWAVVQASRGDTDAALESLLQGRSHDPGNLDIAKNGAELLIKLGRMEEVAAWLNEPAQKNPDDREIQGLLSCFAKEISQ